MPCPVPTDDPARYEGAHSPFRCHSAFTDVNGLVVILREGRPAAAGPGPFGRQHAATDRGVGAEVIARVVSTARPTEGLQRRLHYVEEIREGAEAAEVWVVVDRAPSRQAPDTRPFGVITAFCRSPGGGVPEIVPLVDDRQIGLTCFPDGPASRRGSGRWGYEHGDWSNRIHSFGLTTCSRKSTRSPGTPRTQRHPLLGRPRSCPCHPTSSCERGRNGARQKLSRSARSGFGPCSASATLVLPGRMSSGPPEGRLDT